MTALTTKNIIAGIGRENLSLEKKGNFVFTFYDANIDAWHEHDTGMSELSDATLDEWINMGTDFVEEKSVVSADDMTFLEIEYVKKMPVMKVVSSTDYYNMQVPFKVDENTTYYLVAVEYTTGDSETTESGNICFVEMYTDREMAYDAAKAIRKHNDANVNDGVVITAQNGMNIKRACPWTGYFESLDNIFVYPVNLGNQVKTF